ncbi:MAG: thiamine pyrophosphate-binding protein [Thermodesulfobacteriota bacterium]
MVNKRYSSDLVVDVIKQYDFDYVSFNPGSSFRGLQDSLVHYGRNVKPEIIECPHENTAVGIAHGYAKATEKPMLTILHNLVGLLHGTMAIYYAYTDRVPMVIAGATGPMDIAKRRPHIDWIHTALIQGNLVRDYVKWDDQPYSIESVPDSFARAYRIANTEPKGPTYICFDVSTLEDPLKEEVPLLNVQKLMPPTPVQASQEAFEKAADLLIKAKNPVVLAGTLGRNKKSVKMLVELSELLSLPVIDRMNRFNFPNTHPLDLTGVNCLESADFILSLDVRDLGGAITKYQSYAQVKEARQRFQPIIPKDCKIIEMGFSDLDISSWSMEYEKLQEVDLSILCDTSVALPELIKKCKEKLSDKEAVREEVKRRFKSLSSKHNQVRDKWKEDSRKDWDLKPMTMPRLASEIWEVIKNEDWVLTANSLRGWARRLWDWDEPYRHPGEALGTATQINISLGVALAYKGKDKLIVDIQPDGDLLFDPAALWVASHHRIPMLVIMLNNRAYMNSWNHQISMARERGNSIGMANLGTEINQPAPDFAKLAQSFGWYGEGPIEDGSKVQEALKRAIQVIKKEGRPALVDTVTQFF